MYGKLFASMYEGSMLGAGPEVFALWPYIISTADREGFVELNFELVATKIGMKAKEVEAVVKGFLEPDSRSRSKEKGGRKLERRGEFLYYVINYQHYRAIKNAEDRRESNRLAQERFRAKKKHKPKPEEERYLRTYSDKGQAAADAELDRSQGG